MKKDEKFMPVMTSVLFTGQTWDGPTELYDVLDFGDEEDIESWKEYIPNYKINLVSMADFKNPDVFRSCLQHVFNMVKYKDNKEMFQKYRIEHREELDSMGSIANEALVAILDTTGHVMDKLDKNKDDEEENGMCRAIEELIADGRAEGKIEGKIETKIEQICKKLRKNKTAEVIADELEEDLSFVQKVVDIAAVFAPEFLVEDVYKAWSETTMN